MPSPFPGMNPYLEQAEMWRDFHTSYVVELRRALAPLVAPNYVIKLEDSLYLDATAAGDVFAVADVAVKRTRRPSPAGTATAVVAPAKATLARAVKPARPRQRWLTIHDRRQRRVVTVIELLSPSNKAAGYDRERYLHKRERILDSTAHLVEIDLLRGGQRPPLEDASPCDYRVTVSRQALRPGVDLWPIGLRDPLPAIPIPLNPGDSEPMLALKSALDSTYDGAEYQYELYQGEPNPPLSRADAAWAKKIIRQAGANR